MEMKPIERMNAIRAGEKADRWPWVPSIYEHGALLLGRSPGEVSRDAGLMADAATASYRTYRHDMVTVGIDIYNIEAEAFGCALSSGEGKSIPGVTNHPLAADETLDFSRLTIPQPGPDNRLGLIADAVERVVDEIASEVWIYACMGGPFSQAVELRSFDLLIADMYDAPARVHALLERTTELAIQQSRRLAEKGASVNLYESWATMPLISPPLFSEYVVPYNQRVIAALRDNYDIPPPAVIMGGDMTLLIDFFIAANSGWIAPDYLTDFEMIRAKTSDQPTIIRGNVDPKMIERGDWEELETAVNTLAAKAAGMVRFVWGCGCVSLDTPPDSLLRFKQMALAADRSG